MGRIKVTINAEYIDNKLTAFGKSIEFKNKIVELKENDNCLFVRLLVVPGQELNENTLSNVYANVAPKGNNVYICAPLVGMDIEENDLFVTDFMGRRFEVNQENGELNQVRIVK